MKVNEVMSRNVHIASPDQSKVIKISTQYFDKGGASGAVLIISKGRSRKLEISTFRDKNQTFSIK